MQTLDWRPSEVLPGVYHVAFVLRDVDVKAGSQRLVRLDALAQSPICQREGSVQAEGAAQQTISTRAARLPDKPDVLCNSLLSRFRPVPIGGLIAQHPAQADLTKRLLD